MKSPSRWMRFVAFMRHFWWHVACPRPDGRFNCWLGGKPYTYTARLHLPWYLILHPDRLGRVSPKTWLKVRMVLSVALIPVGVLVWLLGGRRNVFFPKPPDVVFPEVN